MQNNTVMVLEAGGPCSMAALKALRRSDLPVRLIACDQNPRTAARLFADEFLETPLEPERLPAFVSDVARRFGVDIVLPTFHHGYDQLASLDTGIFVMDFNTGMTCLDKLVFYERCLRAGLPVPHTAPLDGLGRIDSPAIIKPRFGVGSRGLYRAQDDNDLAAIRAIVGTQDAYIVQDMLYGTEWAAECIADTDTLLSCTSYRIYQYRAGSSSIVRIADNPELAAFADRVRRGLGLTGAFNLQVFITPGGDIRIIEVNPRHGSATEYISLAGCQVFHYWVTGDERYLQPAETGTYAAYLEAGRVA